MSGALESVAAALGIKNSAAIIPALFGAGVAALRGHLPIWQRIVTFVVGFGMAVYLTHPVIAWFGWSSGAYEHGIAFVLGLFGMTVVEALMTTDWRSIVTRRLGGS